MQDLMQINRLSFAEQEGVNSPDGDITVARVRLWRDNFVHRPTPQSRYDALIVAIGPYKGSFIIRPEARGALGPEAGGSIDFAFTQAERGKRVPHLTLQQLGNPCVPWRASVYPFSWKFKTADLVLPDVAERAQHYRRFVAAVEKIHRRRVPTLHVFGVIP